VSRQFLAKTLRDKLAIKVGSGTAVRPGELFGFRWRSLEQLPNGRQALRVTETVYKCKLRPWAKTEKSEAYVPLPKRLAVELAEWRRLTTSPEDQDFIFPNSQGGFMDYENFEARVLDPIRVQLGLGKLNFQILRRTFATLAVGERKGTLKDVQTQLRHTRPDITLQNYVKEIPDSVYTMVDAMYEGISAAGERQILATAPVIGGIQ
jgi:integrase